MESSHEDYARMGRAIEYLDAQFPRRPALEEVARSVQLSPFHFQRLFKRWTGISPKRFLQYLSLDYAKQALQDSPNLLDASYAAGLSSPGRLHDLFVKIEAVTPGEYRRKGEGLEITWGFADTPFGDCLIAATDRGICALTFILDSGRDGALDDLRAKWPKAQLRRDDKTAREVAARIFASTKGKQPFPVYLKGTNFQIKVWEALLKIPAGAVTTYEGVATSVGRPSAMRAVGNAVGQNPIAFLIPCHRVIRKSGALGGYGGGLPRKRLMLAWEAVHRVEA